MTARLTELGLIRLVRGSARPGSGVVTGIGDDCAVLDLSPGALLLATTDLLLEDVHFRRRYAEPADIGWKALAVNLSDIASMGGRPRWALVALACPAGTDLEEVEACYAGMIALALEHDVSIVGGDTSTSPHGWLLNVTLLGEAAARPLLRSTARVGDVLAVTGPLGRSAAGLALLHAPADVASDVADALTAAHLRPRPRVKEGRWLGSAEGVTAMIDLSDGLVTDLGHIAEESAVGARVKLDRLPVDPSTKAAGAALGRDPLPWVTSGGEDYELLLACTPAAFDRVAAGLEAATGTRLTAIGEVTEGGGGVEFLDAAGDRVRLEAGFEHFVTERPDG